MSEPARRAPANLITLQCARRVTCRIAQIDSEVAELYADDYLVDVDRLLDERGALQDARRELALTEVK